MKNNSLLVSISSFFIKISLIVIYVGWPLASFGMNDTDEVQEAVLTLTSPKKYLNRSGKPSNKGKDALRTCIRWGNPDLQVTDDNVNTALDKCFPKINKYVVGQGGAPEPIIDEILIAYRIASRFVLVFRQGMSDEEIKNLLAKAREEEITTRQILRNSTKNPIQFLKDHFPDVIKSFQPNPVPVSHPRLEGSNEKQKLPEVSNSIPNRKDTKRPLEEPTSEAPHKSEAEVPEPQEAPLSLPQPIEAKMQEESEIKKAVEKSRKAQLRAELDEVIKTKQYKKQPHLRYEKKRNDDTIVRAILEIPKGKKKAKVLGKGKGKSKEEALGNLVDYLSGRIPPKTDQKKKVKRPRERREQSQPESLSTVESFKLPSITYPWGLPEPELNPDTKRKEKTPSQVLDTPSPLPLALIPPASPILEGKSVIPRDVKVPKNTSEKEEENKTNKLLQATRKGLKKAQDYVTRLPLFLHTPVPPYCCTWRPAGILEEIGPNFQLTGSGRFLVPILPENFVSPGCNTFMNQEALKKTLQTEKRNQRLLQENADLRKALEEKQQNVSETQS